MTERIPVTLKIQKKIDRALEERAFLDDRSKSDITEMALVKFLGLDLSTAAREVPPTPAADTAATNA